MEEGRKKERRNEGRVMGGGKEGVRGRKEGGKKEGEREEKKE